MNLLKIGLVQHAVGPDRAATIAKTLEGIDRAAAAGARLVVLQELHCGAYFCQTEATDCFDLAEAIPGPTSALFGAAALKAGVVLVASLFEKRAPGLYHNTAVVFETDGTIAGIYRKMHIPDDPGYHEKFYFTPGDLGFAPVKTSVGTLGVLVCWDQWYPEAARLMALAGADLLLYPTAIGWDQRDAAEEQQRQLDAWLTVQRGHAVANGLPVVAVNRVGHEPDPGGHSPGALFWGTSFVAGPQGELLWRAPADRESVEVVTVDLDRCEDVRRIWPFLRDRRIEAYQDLLKRFRD